MDNVQINKIQKCNAPLSISFRCILNFQVLFVTLYLSKEARFSKSFLNLLSLKWLQAYSQLRTSSESCIAECDFLNMYVMFLLMYSIWVTASGMWCNLYIINAHGVRNCTVMVLSIQKLFWLSSCVNVCVKAVISSRKGQEVTLEVWDRDPGFPGIQNDDYLGR
jgi:hypothetical protein